MDELLDSLKCTQCHRFLTSPVLLPCGHSICKDHVQSSDHEYHCIACDVIHVVPDEGFIKNLALDCQLKANIQDVLVCPEHKSAFDSFKEFEAHLDEFKLIQKDPFFFLNKTIGELKMATDLLREEFKLKIDERADALIKALDNYEQECLKSLNSKELSSPLSKADEQLDKWKASLAGFDMSNNKAKCIDIRTEIKTETKVLEAKLSEYKKSFFLDKLNTYELKVAGFKTIQLHSEQEYD
jgi:hypothetical protein